MLCTLLVLGACSSGDDDAGGGDTEPEAQTTTAPPPASRVDIELGPSTVQGAAEAVLDQTIGQRVFERVGDYVDTALVQPLLTGESARDLEKLFAPALAPRVAPDQPDRAALTDEGVGPVTSDVTVTADDPVALDALSGPDGSILLVAATVTMHLETETEAGALEINRRAELTFEPGSGDEWLVVGYRVLVGRDGPATSESVAATTEAPGTTTEAP